jgi:hypothetical protein
MFLMRCTAAQVPVRIKQAHEVRAADRFTPERCAFTAKFMNEPAPRSLSKAAEGDADDAAAPMSGGDDQSGEEGLDDNDYPEASS